MIGTKKITLAAVLFLAAALVVIHFASWSRAWTWPAPISDAAIQGRVMSIYGPVENARVRVAGDDSFTLSDRQGRFTLPNHYLPGTRVRVTAGKEGWFNNGQLLFVAGGPLQDIVLNPIYLNDQPDYRFIAPTYCAQCHVKVTRYWDQSKMAHTTSNPLVWDMYYGTDAQKRSGVAPGFKLDNPASDGNCTVCHAPSVAASIPRSQDLYSALQPSQSEWDGVSCDYCHKVQKILPDAARPSHTAPLLQRQQAAGSTSVLAFGPYDDVVAPPMAASYNPLLAKGEFCSLCHAHFQKVPNGRTWDSGKIYDAAEWAGFGLKDDSYLPIQTTYQEWRQWQDELPASDPNKGKKCQDCHMSWRKKMLPYDNYVVDNMARNMWGTLRSPQNIHPHQFEGATQAQLETALAMEMEGEARDRKLTVTVYITNTNGGHWVPTGETMRSVMLLVQAQDSAGRPLKMTEGPRLPEWAGQGRAADGNYAGLPGTVFARVLGDDRGNVQVPFWRATRIVQDSRIRPKDSVTLKFEFALDDPNDEPSAQARLIYRPVIRPLAEIKNWQIRDIPIAESAW